MNADGVPVGILVRRCGGYLLRVEGHQVSGQPLPDHPPVLQAYLPRREGSQLPNPLLQGHQPLLSDVRAQEPDGVPVAAWVRLAPPHVPPGAYRAAVRGYHGQRVLHHVHGVLLADREYDEADHAVLLDEQVEREVVRVGPTLLGELLDRPPLVFLMVRAAGDHDSLPAALGHQALPAGYPLDHVLFYPLPSLPVFQSFNDGVPSSFVHPVGEHRREARRVGRPGVDVGRHLHAALPRLLHHPQRLVDLAPVPHPHRLVVGDLHWQPRPLPYLYRLRDCLYEGIPLTPYVGGVYPPVSGRDLRQLYDLLRLREPARGVPQARRQAEGARLHGLRHVLLHHP